MWRKGLSLWGVAALVLSFFALEVPASAQIDDDITAAITGFTDTPTAPPTFPPGTLRTGTFDDTQIAGEFTANDHTCVAIVAIGTVEFTTHETLLEGSGGLPGGETFSADCVGGGMLSGTIMSGTFTRTANVALASVEILFLVNGLTATVTVHCVITASPLPPDFVTSAVAGECNST